MEVTSQDILKLICTIYSKEQIYTTVNESIKGGIIAGTSAVIGGLIAGPVGLAVGSTIGGLIGAKYGKGKYKSLILVIQNDLNENERKELFSNVKAVLTSLGTISMTPTVVQMVSQVVDGFFVKKGYQIIK